MPPGGSRGATSAVLWPALTATVLVLAPSCTQPSSPPVTARSNTYGSTLDAVEYHEEDIPGTSGVLSIGASSDRLIVTSSEGGGEDEYENAVDIFDNTARRVAAFKGVRGLALTDPAGRLAAWMEVTHFRNGSNAHAVAVDTRTGEELDRIRFDDTLTQVMSVWSGSVALSDGDSSFLWVTGDGLRPLDYVPDAFYLVGLSEDRVVASNLNQGTHIYSMDGRLVKQVPDLVSWDVDPTNNLLAGATDSGAVTVVDLSNGDSTSFDPGLEAIMASFVADGSILVNGRSLMTGGSDESWPADPSCESCVTRTVSICDLDQGCELITTDGVPYLPNEALSQIGSQSQ